MIDGALILGTILLVISLLLLGYSVLKKYVKLNERNKKEK